MQTIKVGTLRDSITRKFEIIGETADRYIVDELFISSRDVLRADRLQLIEKDRLTLSGDLTIR